MKFCYRITFIYPALTFQHRVNGVDLIGFEWTRRGRGGGAVVRFTDRCVGVEITLNRSDRATTPSILPSKRPHAAIVSLTIISNSHGGG